MEERIQILDHGKIQLKTSRIARHLLEDFYQEHEIVLVGIKGSGFEFAKRIAAELQKVSPETSILLGDLYIDKKNPNLQSTYSDISSEVANNKVVVVIDDVLNTGKTLLYGVTHFLGYQPKCIKTAVLVDRSHNDFPIKADYIGFPMATTLMEHVKVVFEENDSKAYLE
ncbi:MAG: phosphoribosyltransferase [Bacteroidia bacterium]|nr:phosphoribosyltransferase [Bacteroidia bacterium]